MVKQTLRLIACLTLAYLLAFLVYRGLTVEACVDLEEEEVEPGRMERAVLVVARVAKP